MCGIWGTYHPTSFDSMQKDVLYQMFRVGLVRGMHGTGIARVGHDDEVEFMKAAYDPNGLMWTEGYDKFMPRVMDKSRFVFGHHRHATKGEINAKNAHPFQHGHITMVHNGTLTSGIDMTKFDVDSDGLCALIAEKGVHEAFAEVEGAYACVWWDANEKTLNIVKNGQRTLYIAKANQNYFWASEKKMLEWLLMRNYTTLAESSIVWTYPEPDTVYQFHNGGLVKLKETIQKKYKPAGKVYYPATHWKSKYEQEGATSTTAAPAPAPANGAVSEDFLADFYLIEEEKKEFPNGRTMWKYLGITIDSDEDVFMWSPDQIDDFDRKHWHATLLSGPRYNYNKHIDPNSEANAIFYEIDPGTLLHIIEPKKIITLDGYTLSKQQSKRFIKTCVACPETIKAEDIDKCLTLTTSDGEDRPLGLFCPSCTQKSITKKREAGSSTPTIH